MPAYSATAPGKVILFGEHAVVYGRPALAVPVLQVKAKAIVMAEPRAPRGQVKIIAPNIELETTLDRLPEDHPLAVVIHKGAEAMQINHIPACSITITSTIPIASGMGSGAAVSVAILRALAALVGRPLNDEQISAVVFQAEQIYHGTPSGIDNSVITYARPVYFIKGKPIEILVVKKPFTLVIGETGLKSLTAAVVGDVRHAWECQQRRFEGLFDAAQAIAQAGRRSIETGEVETLGALMDKNHNVLQQMGVSSIELDRLVEAAKSAGAMGAKLSGAGRGGSMLALVRPNMADAVATGLMKAGAVGTITTEVKPL
jgi:mevalonate kinase